MQLPKNEEYNGLYRLGETHNRAGNYTFGPCTTRKMIYRKTSYSFLVWADNYTNTKNKDLFFVSADLIVGVDAAASLEGGAA
jgi:hypothetical protein